MSFLTFFAGAVFGGVFVVAFAGLGLVASAWLDRREERNRDRDTAGTGHWDLIDGGPL